MCIGPGGFDVAIVLIEDSSGNLVLAFTFGVFSSKEYIHKYVYTYIVEPTVTNLKVALHLFVDNLSL